MKNDMKNDMKDGFGQRLVAHCRDASVWAAELPLKSTSESRRDKRWTSAAISAGGVVPPSVVIPDSVDTALSYLLIAIDQEMLGMSFSTARGESVYLPEDGQSELSGWYGGAWRTWYSKERIEDLDDFANPHDESSTNGIPDDPAPNLDELPMPRRAIEELGILLVRHVRDVAIRSCDAQLVPDCDTPMAKRWRREAIPFGGRIPPDVLIPDCVDMTIVAFLRAIDQGLLRLSFTAENGDVVDLVKDGQGELASQYLGREGWRAQFSKERFFEDALVG